MPATTRDLSPGAIAAAARTSWPLERVLFALAGTITLLSALLAATVSTWFLLLTAFVGINQWLYVRIGNCPASLVLGRFGVSRTCRWVNADSRAMAHEGGVYVLRVDYGECVDFGGIGVGTQLWPELGALTALDDADAQWRMLRSPVRRMSCRSRGPARPLVPGRR